jgi:HSP20 family protein
VGFRRIPEEPGPDLPEEWLRLFAGARPAQPAIEETELPAIDVFETATELVIEAELPGVDPSTVGVGAGEGLVVIEGTKQDLPLPERVNYLCMERSFGAFRRVVLTGAAVDPSRATAAYRNGVLQVRVPKVDEKRGRLRVIPVVAERSGQRSEP